MKRFTASILLTVFAYSIVGLHLLGGFVLKGLKEMWRERLSGQQAVTLVFSKGEPIPWVEEHEVVVNGILYDVEKVKTTTIQTILTAFADGEEQQLQETIAGLNVKKERNTSEAAQQGAKLLTLEFVNQFEIPTHVIKPIENQISHRLVADIPESFLKKNSPPPERG